MAKKYVYSCYLGIFLIDENFKLDKKIDIKEKDVNFSEWLDEEKNLIKSPKDELFYLGYKKEKLDGIKLTQDPKKIDGLINFLKDYKEDFYKINLKNTKKKVSESVSKDNLMVQAINNIEEIDKVCNTLVKRLREWYELYLPEFSKNTENHEKFVDIILKRNKEKLLDELNLKEENCMGGRLELIDIKSMLNLASSVKNLYELKDKHEQYLDSVMKEVCPNLKAITGTLIGAKLLSHTGNIRKLAMIPASTIQLLGAEKALFRHLKTGSRPPKYGILLQHPIVNKVSPKDKGKAARALADKISIAVKVDLFKGKPIGEKLKAELEERFR